MFTIINKSLKALAEYFDAQEQRRREAYLATSVDIYELEFRMQALLNSTTAYRN